MRRSPPYEAVVLIGAALLLVATVGLLCLLPGTTTDRTGGVETITLNPWRGSLYLAALASSILVLCVSFWVARRLEWRSAWIVFAVGFFSPVLCFPSIFELLEAHEDLAGVRDQDGREYHLLSAQLYDGSFLAIGRLKQQRGLFETYEILVQSSMKPPFQALGLVRSQNADGGELRLTQDRVLVGLRDGNRAVVAYDLKKGQGYDGFDGGASSQTIRHLSPFLLLGKRDVPRQADFRALLNPKNSARPFPSAVEGDLKHENPAVRELARQLLDELRRHPPVPQLL